MKLRIPVGLGEVVELDGDWPLTGGQWGQFDRVLRAMRPALTVDGDVVDVEREKAGGRGR